MVSADGSSWRSFLIESASNSEMKFTANFACALLPLLIVLVLIPFPALASLGGNASSIDADQTVMKGTAETRQASAYTVHEIKAASGTTVREYISSSGMVFAVGWKGPFVPNLQQLLGSYFDQYSRGVQQEKATYVGRRPLDLELPGLVVQRNGHMRAEYGRAYLPLQIPAGVNVEDLW
jgi:hypothetical protein